MEDNEHTAYFSKRIRLADVTSPKEFFGMKERTLEVVVGNSDKPKTYTNPKDVAAIKQQNLKEMLLELFDMTDEIGKIRNFKYVDQYKTGVAK